MNAMVDTLMQLLAGSPQAPQPARPITPTPPSAYQPRPQMPATAPIPTPRPPLPGGSFSPNATQAPPLPTPEAAMPAPQAMPEAPQPAPQQQNVLQQLLGMGPNKDIRTMLRAFGAGASNAGNTGGDPFTAFGRGFGGATGHYDVNDALRAKAAAAGEERDYDRSQDAEKMAYARSKDDRDYALRQTSEARQSRVADLTERKTAMEIRKMARSNGISGKEMVEIERAAQAAAEGEYDMDARKAKIDETRTRLLDAYKQGEGLSSGGVSGDSLSNGGDVPMAVNEETGETLYLRDGQWVAE